MVLSDSQWTHRNSYQAVRVTASIYCNALHGASDMAPEHTFPLPGKQKTTKKILHRIQSFIQFFFCLWWGSVHSTNCIPGQSARWHAWWYRQEVDTSLLKKATGYSTTEQARNEANAQRRNVWLLFAYKQTTEREVSVLPSWQSSPLQPSLFPIESLSPSPHLRTLRKAVSLHLTKDMLLSPALMRSLQWSLAGSAKALALSGRHEVLVVKRLQALTLTGPQCRLLRFASSKSKAVEAEAGAVAAALKEV